MGFVFRFLIGLYYLYGKIGFYPVGEVCISGSPPKILVCHQKLMNFDILHYYMSSGQGVNWSRCEFIISGLSHRKLGSSQKMMNYDILYGKIGGYPVGGSGPGQGMHFS